MCNKVKQITGLVRSDGWGWVPSREGVSYSSSLEPCQSQWPQGLSLSRMVQSCTAHKHVLKRLITARCFWQSLHTQSLFPSLAPRTEELRVDASFSVIDVHCTRRLSCHHTR